MPIYKGDWSEGITVKEKFRFTYRGSEFQALRDGLTTAPLNDSDQLNDGWIYISNGTDAYRAAEKIAAVEAAIAEEKGAIMGTKRIADRAVTISKLSEEIISYSKNRFNPNDPDVKVGYYLNQDGDLVENSSYIVTGYIPFSESEGSLVSSINGAANDGGGYSELYDSQKNRIAGFINSSNNGTLKWQEGVAYARFSIYTGAIGRNIQIEQGEVITAYEPFSSVVNIKESLLPILSADKIANGAVTTTKIVDEAITLSKLSSEIIDTNRSKNRFNPNDPEVKEGYYLNQDGILLANSNYIVTGYIPFSKEDSSLISSYNSAVNDGGGFSELYDSQKNRITGFINSSTNGILKWQEGVAYARFSIQTGEISANIQVEQGESITAYEPYTAGSYIRESLIPALNDLNPIKSLTGKEAETATAASLTDTGKIELTNFPWHIKKGLVMSMYAKVTSFSALLVGKGYMKYRGDYLRINTTQIVQIRYDSSEIVKETVTHGLNIQSFVKVSLTSDNSGRMYVVLQSKGGKFEYKFNNWAFEANYAPFVLSEGSTLTDVELSAGCQDFRLPVWAFGDSYFGVDASRWIGVMKDFGYFNFLVNGLAGQSSAGAYADLERCLKFGTPKFLLWCLGMNDTDANFKAYFEKVRSICKSNNITLIAATVPTVPTRNKEIITQYVKDSGLRYIDFYKAVGTSSSGTWYDGYLNADGVHPNAIGAQALATQVLADFPELMQYGKTVELITNSQISTEAQAREKADVVHDSRILELEKAQWPLVLSLTLSNTLLEYTGEGQTISASYNVKHKGVLKLPKTLSLTQDEVVITNDPAKEDTAPITVNKLGGTVVKLSATAHSYYDYHSDKTDDIISASIQKTIQMVLPIYAGFGTSADSVKTDANKLSVRTSAAGTYTKTCQADGQNFYILVPRTFAALTSFTMGGAPFVMETSDITLGDYEYKQYKSGAVYNTGATVNIKAS